MKSYNKIAAPKYTEEQKLRTEKNSEKLARKLRKESNLIPIMDDETCVPVDACDVPGQGFYTMNQEIEVPASYKIKPKAKFSKKYLIWQAIDQNEWLRSNGIKFVEKSNNASNLSQARPIELFWALCKREYAKRSKPTLNVKQFRAIWKKISSKVAFESGPALMDNVINKILKVARKEILVSTKSEEVYEKAWEVKNIEELEEKV
ncbi:hypothetical protein ILUMI_25139 [Ignelater luminosus]|uniref:Uncharacterized protein n=1 Tax=Ignelater luminosus TaxID=2038154 RepID=A0A8K0CB40_IGNLU|nr:hypothetical protein ILUMI_25139 [Ignelater luminosus]